MQSIHSVIIFRALQLGDLLCSVPAFRALRYAYPKAHIAIAGLPWMKSFVNRFREYIDEFIWFPGYPGLPEQPIDAAATIQFLKEVNGKKFDLALQMQGNGSIVNPLVELFGARYTAGFRKSPHYAPASGLFLTYPEAISEVHRHLLLMQHIGVMPCGEHLEFPLAAEDEQELDALKMGLEEGTFICVHPGSRGAERRWPPELFARVSNLCRYHGWKIVLTGTAEELPIIETVSASIHVKPIILAGKTSLGAMAALLRRSGGLISNCTGVSHLAAALKKKSVVISMDGEPKRWAPLNKTLHATVDWTRHPQYELVEQAVLQQFASVASPQR